MKTERRCTHPRQRNDRKATPGWGASQPPTSQAVDVHFDATLRWISASIPLQESGCIACDGSQYARRMHVWVAVGLAAVSLATPACDEANGPSSPTTQPGSVRIVFAGSTTRRSDLPSSAQSCVSGVGATHMHPSWRAFVAIPLQPRPADRYEIEFTDVPVNMRVSFRVNDQNACDENPTGAVTRNVSVQDCHCPISPPARRHLCGNLSVHSRNGFRSDGFISSWMSSFIASRE